MQSGSQTDLVIYYSRSHHSQEVADAIAVRLHANTFEIETNRYFLPILGFLRAGFNSIRGSLPTLTKPTPNFHDYKRVIICGPVWTSFPSTPLRAFISQYKASLPDDVSLFLTCGDQSEPLKAYEMATQLLGHPFKVAMSLSNAVHKEVGVDTKVDAFCAALEDETPKHASA